MIRLHTVLGYVLTLVIVLTGCGRPEAVVEPRQAASERPTPDPSAPLPLCYVSESKDIGAFLKERSDVIPSTGMHIEVKLFHKPEEVYNRMWDIEIPDAKIYCFTSPMIGNEMQFLPKHEKDIPVDRIRKDLVALLKHLKMEKAEMSCRRVGGRLKLEEFRKLKPGMTTDQVKEIVGTPVRNNGGIFWAGEYDLFNGETVTVMVGPNGVISASYRNPRTGKSGQLLPKNPEAPKGR